MRSRARVDANQAEIVDALRRVGRTVLLLHQLGEGIPDILVGNGTRNFLVEIKILKGRLTPQQEEFHQTWRGPIVIARSAEEAILLTA